MLKTYKLHSVKIIYKNLAIWLLACNWQAILREFWSGQTLWGRLGCKYLQERDGDYKSVCGNWSRESQGLSRPRTRVKHFGQERNKVAARRKSGKNTSRGAAPFCTWDWSLWNVGWCLPPPHYPPPRGFRWQSNGRPSGRSLMKRRKGEVLLSQCPKKAIYLFCVW